MPPLVPALCRLVKSLSSRTRPGDMPSWLLASHTRLRLSLGCGATAGSGAAPGASSDEVTVFLLASAPGAPPSLTRVPFAAFHSTKSPLVVVAGPDTTGWPACWSTLGESTLTTEGVPAPGPVT